MKHIIENWRHQPGRHCASTALRDTLSFWGLPLSEAFCFGLGRGIGVFYLSIPNFSPSKWLRAGRYPAQGMSGHVGQARPSEQGCV